MRMVGFDYDYVLTPEQHEKLTRLFHDVDENKRRRAIHFIDRGVAVYNAMQADEYKPHPGVAALQVERIRPALQIIIEELNSLSPDTVETFNSVAVDFPNFQKIVCDVTGRGIIDQLHNFHSLCFKSKEKLPKLNDEGKLPNHRHDGTDNRAGKSLATDIREAYGVAYDEDVSQGKHAKRTITRIYRIIKIAESPRIMIQLTKNTEDIK